MINLSLGSLRPLLYLALVGGASIASLGCRPLPPPCTSSTCTPSSACMTATCTPLGCKQTPLPAGTACSDGSACTTDGCDGRGKCLSTPIVLSTSACLVTTCDPALGIVTAPAPSGTACTLDACTVDAACQAGTCTGGTPRDCSSGQACVTDGCDLALGCTHSQKPAGADCSDANICNGTETCSAAGTCDPGTPVSIDDANICTADSCDPIAGVVHTSLPAGTACSDGSACTTDGCDGLGKCLSTPIVLPTSACLVTTCDPELGIVTAPALNGTACTLDACTVGAACQAGTCTGGTPRDCSLGNACVTDGCDSALGCTHTQKPAGADCSDANVCNGTETCSAVGTCDPGIPVSIDDANICTSDSCDPIAGVVHAPLLNCDPTPVQGDAPFETRASILGRLVSSTGGAITGAMFTVYDERATEAPRSDILTSIGADGSFRLKLTNFPEAEPARTPPHRLVVVIDSPGTIRAYREGYAHPGDTLNLGEVQLIARDSRVTNIGPEGGTAQDSQGLVELVVPAGALTSTVPIQITPLRTREEFPAPLPDATLTMYGFELEPTGTTFAAPVTVRMVNYRNLPTTLAIPVGSYDPVENRWEHEGVAHWDGARFAVPITHFTTYDGNAAGAGDLLLVLTREPSPNAGASKCGMGSSWRVGGGSLDQSFTLPSMRVRGQAVSLSLHYASGLAGTRKLGAPPDNAAAPSVVPRGSLAVSAPGVKITAQCVARGGGAPSAMQPGSCSSIGGSCGLGGGGVTAMGIQIDMLGATLHQLRTLPEQAKEAEFGGWVEIPLATPEQVTEPGLVSQRISVKGDGLSACAASGGAFGVPDPMDPRVQLSGVEAGAYMTVTRKVLVHHRFNSPYGAGWAVREVSRLYVDGDVAHLVSGEGQEEEFRPRARVTPIPDNLGELAVARDPRTGEIFAAIMPGRIVRLDPVTGAPTDVLGGLAFSTTSVHALTIGYVGSVRHFVVATATALLDIDGGGNKRTLASRAHFGNTLYNQASVAAHDDVIFYTSGDDATPVLYRSRLSDAVPSLEVLSAAIGDTRLHPRKTLTSVQFAAPRGLAFAQDGSLLVADPRRHVVYGVYPSASGTIEPTSNVRVVLGMGAGRYAAAVGERQPALVYSINQPVRLAVAGDGIVLVMNSYGITAFDPVAREAELLFVENGRDEILASLAGIQGLTPSTPTSFVALTSSSMFSRTFNHGLVRVDVEPLASTQDPTRVLRRLPGASGGFELTDTTAAKVWRFDALGRMLEQRERTGEIDFTVRYDDPRRARVDAIVDAVGGEHVFTYAGPGDKLSAIRDPAGRVTTLTVDERGDLVRLVEPDGEVRTFTYDAHRMVKKTSPRGDVTSYTYRDDGTMATSTKPGGETYSFEPALGTAPSYDAAGASVRSGAYTDARGVRHTFRTDKFGGIDEETLTADGVTRTLRAVYPDTVGSFDEPGAAGRRNAFLRTSHYTLNGVPLSAPIKFDSLGRPSRQQRIFGGGTGRDDMHRWDYAPDGWLVEAFWGPANFAQRIERDAAGHVTRIFDAAPRSGGLNPTGRETRETRFTWRPDGQPATMTEHGVMTTFTYDDAGLQNLTGSFDTLGRTLSLGYDAYGNLTSTSDGTASATFVFDAANRLRTSRDALGYETTFRYEHVGCGCSERDEITGIHTPDLPAGVEWTMSYGPKGRLAGVTDPHGFTEAYTYEATGEVKTVIDRLNRTTTMQHDDLGRLLAVVDTLGRRQGRAYSVPGSGTWNGPTVTAGSADGSAATSTLAAPLRDGDYQLGVNALDVEGFPAQISLYRDATFALGHTHFFDNAGRPTGRRDRVGTPIESATLPVGSGRGSFVDETHGWDPGTALPVMALTASASGASSSFESADYRRNIEYDLMITDGFWGGSYVIASKETLVRDAGGRVKSNSRQLYNVFPVVSTYEYRLDGRLGRVTNPDGDHNFTYDARGLLATQTVKDEGMYTYGYDETGRSTTITFPDGHLRRQVFDALGRITSRCYEYPANALLNRCYSAQYDAVGNPVRLTDPEGADVLVYDALDRLKSVTREEGGVTVGVETYDFNALGALKVNAGEVLDHRRPRLDGAGIADAAVPASLGGQPVTLDAGGRVTSLRGTTLTWNTRGQLREAAPPIPAEPERYGIDSQMRRFARIQGSSVELYVYEGDDRIAILDGSGATKETYLFAGIDDPLRMQRGTAVTVYFELDLAGNVRRLRGMGGTDLGGYRYSAFGKTVEDDALVDQRLRWKGRWHQNIGGSEIYNMRARQWSPELGSFLSIDDYRIHDRNSTFWGWPKQSPVRLRDPFGRGPFVAVGVGAGVGVDSPAAGGQVSAGVILGDGIASGFTSSGSISAGVGATVGASVEVGYAFDNKAFFGAGEQLTFSLWNFSINLQFTQNGDLSAFSGAYEMSTGNKFGIFHFKTQTPGSFISAEELDEMERNATEPLTGQQCEFRPGVTALPE